MVEYGHLSTYCSDRILLQSVRKRDISRILIADKEVKIHNRLVTKKKVTQCQRDRLYKAREELKLKIVDAMGGKCQQCGYSKYKMCLAFHHTDPKTKDGDVGDMLKGAAKSYLAKDFTKVKLLIDEVKKCMLVCPTCHSEIHYLEKVQSFAASQV